MVTGSPGCYSLLLTSSSAEFKTDQAAFVNIGLKASESTAPQISSIIFANDGRYVFINFNTATDRGRSAIPQFTSLFQCSELVQSQRVHNTTCQWTSSAQVQMNVFQSYSDLNVDTMLILQPRTIRAECGAGEEECQLFPYASSDAGRPVLAPSDPIVPTIVAPILPTIHSGMDVVIDLTASTGQCNHGWKRIKWSVAYKLNYDTEPARHLAQFLNVHFNTSTGVLIVIPSTLVSVGAYTLKLYVENIFCKSSSVTLSLNIAASNYSVPLIGIAGPPKLNLRRAQSLNLQATLQMPADIHLTSVVSYTWRVYDDMTLNSSLVSVSVDPLKFQLNPYALQLLHIYTIEVTFVCEYGSNTATVSVMPVSAGVFAVIAGGSEQCYGFNSTVVLDASASYDLDYPLQSAQASSSLAFVWSCSQISPLYGSACGAGWHRTVKRNPSILRFSNGAGGPLLPGASYDFVVTVQNDYNMSAATSVRLQVIGEASIPKISIGDVKIKYNANSPVVISGEVALSEAKTAYVAWSSQSVNLTLVAVTSLGSAVVGPMTALFTLSLQANTLFPGMSYQVQLAARYGGGQAAFSLVTLVMNEPPGGGTVRLSLPHLLIVLLIAENAFSKL